MNEANTDRAVLAGSVGACGALIAFPAGWIWFLMDFDFALFSTPEPPDAADKFFAYVVAPAFLIVAGTLCARVMGAGWWLALVASVAASALASSIVIFSAYDLRALSAASIIAPGLLALIVSIRTGGDAPAFPTVIFATGLLAIVGVAVFPAELLWLDAMMSLSAWIMLPAIAGLFQPIRDEPEIEPDS